MHSLIVIAFDGMWGKRGKKLWKEWHCRERKGRLGND
jgi:hypothetical protein